MIAPQPESYSKEEQSIWALFDLRYPGVPERLHRERAAWQKQSEIEAIDKDHLVLIVRAGGARRLTR